MQSNTSSAFSKVRSTASSAWGNIRSTVNTAATGARSAVSTAWSSVRSTTSSVFSGVRSTVSSGWNNVKSTISSGASSALSTVKSKFGSIKSSISSLMGDAKDAVSSAISTMRSKFNFKWSLPKLKLPHVKITGSFSLMPPRVPKFSVSWYRDAMDNPMLLTSATIFGASGNSLLGAGEAGPEVVSGADTLMRMMRDAVDETMDDRLEVIGRKLDELLALMGVYYPQFASAKVTLSTGQLVGGIAPEMDRALGRLRNKRERQA